MHTDSSTFRRTLLSKRARLPHRLEDVAPADLKPELSLKATVDSVDEPSRCLPSFARLTVEFPNGNTAVRTVPLEYLEAVQAAFPGAKVMMEVYQWSNLSTTRFRYIGPSEEELRDRTLKRIPEEDIQALEAPFTPIGEVET